MTAVRWEVLRSTQETMEVSLYSRTDKFSGWHASLLLAWWELSVPQWLLSSWSGPNMREVWTWDDGVEIVLLASWIFLGESPSFPFEKALGLSMMYLQKSYFYCVFMGSQSVTKLTHCEHVSLRRDLVFSSFVIVPDSCAKMSLVIYVGTIMIWRSNLSLRR